MLIKYENGERVVPDSESSSTKRQYALEEDDGLIAELEEKGRVAIKI